MTGSVSKVSKANPRSTSLQVVIPVGIVQQMDLKPGDYLVWDLRSEDGNVKYVIVKKAADNNRG